MLHVTIKFIRILHEKLIINVFTYNVDKFRKDVFIIISDCLFKVKFNKIIKVFKLNLHS